MDIVITHFYLLKHLGHDVANANRKAIATELRLDDSTVRRVWKACLDGKHPSPPEEDLKLLARGLADAHGHRE